VSQVFFTSGFFNGSSPNPLIIPVVSLKFVLKICEWICGFAIQVVLPVSMTLTAKFTTDVIDTGSKFTTLAFTLFPSFSVHGSG
jgi:hypothetical protein